MTEKMAQELLDGMVHTPEFNVYNTFLTIGVHDIKLTEDEVVAIRSAFSTRGKTKGYLKSKCPSGLAGAAWQAINPNAYKISFMRCMFFNEEERNLFLKIGKIKFSDSVDLDKDTLKKLGAW
jgi:hypothetical protein